MDNYRNILQKTYDKKIPLTAHFELTYRCNLSCLHCYAANRKIADELSISQIENVLQQLADMGCLFLTFTGGEIFVRNDTLSILQTAKHLNFALQLFTNGTLITEGIADNLADIMPMSVEMSLYSIDPAIHDRITKLPSSHAQTLHAIKLCRDRGLNTVIKTPLMTYNASEFDAVRDFAEKAGCRFVFDFMLVPTDSGDSTMIEHGLSEDQIMEFLIKHADKGITPPSKTPGSAPLCGAGSNALCINPYGDVFPCLAIREPVGNIKQQTLADIWHSSVLDKIRNTRYCNVHGCRDCDLSGFCSHCAGIGWAECGEINRHSESECLVARATKRAYEALK